MFVIDIGSEAGFRLTEALAKPSTYKVSIDLRGDEHLAMKVNEGMWTHNMRFRFPETG